MIRVKVQFGHGAAVDTYDTFRMIYLSSDNRFGAPLKAMESTAYPEENGVHYYDKVAFDAFDYKIKFLVEGTTLETVNDRIKAFNDRLISDHRLQQITIYNPYKNTKIVGLPQPLAQATAFWVDSHGNKAGAAQVELTVKVGQPDLCDFNYKEQ